MSTGNDSHQVIVSTLGDLINAKSIAAGPRSTQWLGQMSDDSNTTSLSGRLSLQVTPRLNQVASS